MNDVFSDLKKKTALITGASGSIGAATAKLFSQWGIYCWLHYNSNEDDASALLDTIKQEGGDDNLIKADMQNPEDIAALVETITMHGNLDILVNNSGTTRDALIMDMKDEEFRDVTDINLLAPFMLIRDLGKKMMKAGSGKIINISSVASLRGGPGQANYAASKAGLEALTRIAFFSSYNAFKIFVAKAYLLVQPLEGQPVMADGGYTVLIT